MHSFVLSRMRNDADYYFRVCSRAEFANIIMFSILSEIFVATAKDIACKRITQDENEIVK